MIKRIIDISEAAYVCLKHQQLIIEKQGEVVGQVRAKNTINVMFSDRYMQVSVTN
jgi:hypothetical protein